MLSYPAAWSENTDVGWRLGHRKPGSRKKKKKKNNNDDNNDDNNNKVLPIHTKIVLFHPHVRPQSFKNTPGLCHGAPFCGFCGYSVPLCSCSRSESASLCALGRNAPPTYRESSRCSVCTSLTPARTNHSSERVTHGRD